MKKKLYREVCIFTSRASVLFSPYLAFAYLFTIFSVVTNLFVLFRYISSLHPFVLQIFAMSTLVLALSDTFLNQSCVDLVARQGTCLNSHHKNVSRKESWEGKFWKGFRPLAISIGGTFTIESPNFVMEVYWQIIIDAFVNIILTVRWITESAIWLRTQIACRN